MKITTETAKVYKLRGEPNDFAWAIITIRSWKGGGQIDVQSDYGNYAYLWASIGNQDFREFLCKVGFDYFMGKAHHKRGYQVDWDATAENLKRLVLVARREGMDADKARACFEALEAIDKDEGFFWNARDYDDLRDFLQREEYPKKEIRCPDAEGFWKRIWPHACAFWKAELTAEAEAEAMEGLQEPVTAGVAHG